MVKPLYRVLILAGSRSSNDPVACAAGVSCKAFTPLSGKPMVEHVIDAVEKSGRAKDILVSLDPESPLNREAPDLLARFQNGELLRHDSLSGPSASVLSVLQSLAPDERMFVTTADHPLLSADLIRSFLDVADTLDTDIATGLTPLELVQKTYPRNRRTRLNFKDGDYSGCNMFALMGPDARKGVMFWQRMEHDRKSPVRLVARAGLAGLCLWLLNRLTLNDAMERLGKRAGITVSPVIIHNADAATDIDSAEDLKLVRNIFAKRFGNKQTPD